jgi:hypothetical protein
MVPEIISTIEITIAVTGLLIKVLAIIFHPIYMIMHFLFDRTAGTLIDLIFKMNAGIFYATKLILKSYEIFFSTSRLVFPVFRSPYLLPY